MHRESFTKLNGMEALKGDISTQLTNKEESICPLLDDQQWSENDLFLAAELGKTLLERNRDLEARLMKSDTYARECELEIKLLNKQVDNLRELNEQKMRVYEEVDRHSHEVERVNEKLRQDLLQEQCKYAQLYRAKASLDAHLEEQRAYTENVESQVQELQVQLQQSLHGDNFRLKVSGNGLHLKIPIIGEGAESDGAEGVDIISYSHNRGSSRNRRASSVPNVRDECNSLESRNSRVKSFWPPPDAADWDVAIPINHRLRILQLTSELRSQRQRARTLADDVDQLMSENWLLKDQLLTCEEKLRQLHLEYEEDRLASEEDDRFVLRFESDHVTSCGEPSHLCPNKSNRKSTDEQGTSQPLKNDSDMFIGEDLETELYSNVEHDYPELGYTSPTQAEMQFEGEQSAPFSRPPLSQVHLQHPTFRDIQVHVSGARVYSPMTGSPMHGINLHHGSTSVEHEALLRSRKDCVRQVRNTALSDEEWQEDIPIHSSEKRGNVAVNLLSPLWRMRSQTTQVDALLKNSGFSTSSMYSSQQTSLAGSMTSLTPSGVFQQRLDHIFSQDSARIARRDLMEDDYKPRYKELFRDAFLMLREMKDQTAAKRKAAQEKTANEDGSGVDHMNDRLLKDKASQTMRRPRRHLHSHKKPNQPQQQSQSQQQPQQQHQHHLQIHTQKVDKGRGKSNHKR